MVLSDLGIRSRLTLPDDHPRRLRIEPYAPMEDRPGVISYGLSSAGYDLRLGREYKVFSDTFARIVSPKRPLHGAFVDVVGDTCIIPPHGFALAKSMEWIRVPRDVIVTCLGKSTYVRCGVMACVTPLEPEWEGHVTVEISNTSPLPAEVFSGEGILQLLFHTLDQPCEVSYADKGGRYQGQTGITLPFVR